MARASKPSIESLLSELDTLRNHATEYAQATAADAYSSVEARAGSLGSVICGVVRTNAFSCIVGAFVLGLAAAGIRRSLR